MTAPRHTEADVGVKGANRRFGRPGVCNSTFARPAASARLAVPGQMPLQGQIFGLAAGVCQLSTPCLRTLPIQPRSADTWRWRRESWELRLRTSLKNPDGRVGSFFIVNAI